VLYLYALRSIDDIASNLKPMIPVNIIEYMYCNLSYNYILHWAWHGDEMFSL